MLPFLALHNIAAQRGDGLRPELLRLLKRSRAHPEDCRASTPSGGDRSTARSSPDLASANTDSLYEGVLRLPVSRR